MSEKILCKDAKAVSAVDQAAFMANNLVTRESRGPGDLENAMHRLEARYGIPWRTFWALRYRKPSDVFVSVFERLNAAYLAEQERQTRLLRHEIELTKIKAGAFHPAVAAAQAALGEEVE